jgi:hypothetical protein
VSVPICCGFWHIRPSFNCEPTPSHRSPIDEVVSETSAIVFSSINTILLAFPSAFPFSVVRAEPAVDFQCGLIDSIASFVPVEVGSQFWSFPLHLESRTAAALLSFQSMDIRGSFSSEIDVGLHLTDFAPGPPSPKYAGALRSLPSPPHLRNLQSAETLIPLTHSQDKKLIAQQRQTAEVLVHHFNRYFFE